MAAGHVPLAMALTRRLAPSGRADRTRNGAQRLLCPSVSNAAIRAKGAGGRRAGAVPVHAFHVLDVFPRVGLMRGGQAIERAVQIMDSCRIRWGRVLERDGDWLVVSAVPLELVDGKLALAAPRVERIRGWRDGTGFVDGVEAGDVVSIHWDWACERLDDRRIRLLQAWTARELAIANETI